MSADSASATMSAQRGGSHLHVFLRRHTQAYLFLLPSVVLVAIVSVYPIGYSLFLSLFETRYLERVEFVGLGNYYNLFFDPIAWKNLSLSLVYVAGSIGVVIPFSIGVALLLNEPIRFKAAFRAIIILPWAVSHTIIALLWGWILNPDFGPGVYMAEMLGLGRVAPLSDPHTALVTLIGLNAWGSYPLAATLFLAAVQTIPGELSEAAAVDGASPWQHFWLITLPIIKPTILIATVLLSLQSFNMVTLVFILTGGGPMGATEVLSLRTFNEAFQFWRIGYSTALGMCIFVVNVVFSLIYIRLLNREDIS